MCYSELIYNHTCPFPFTSMASISLLVKSNPVLAMISYNGLESEIIKNDESKSLSFIICGKNMGLVDGQLEKEKKGKKRKMTAKQSSFVHSARSLATVSYFHFHPSITKDIS